MGSAAARWLVAGAAALVLVVSASVYNPRDFVLWNGTESMPKGLYWRTQRMPALGAIVTVRAVDAAPAIAARRNFDDAGDRFLKRIAAIPGDVVCAHGEDIFVNGRLMARRRRLDSQSEPLPAWEGCVRLEDEYLLLGDSASSFDGRYFGPVRSADIEGVWTR